MADTEQQIDEKPLTARQEAFVREYLLDLNATQAYIRAGYSPHTAGVAGHQLLNNPKIAAQVERGKAARASRCAVTQDQVLQEMSLLANSRLEHYFIDDEGQVRPADGAPEGCMGAISSIKRKVKVFPDGSKVYDVELRLWDKPAPLKLMGRHVGLFADRVEVTGKDGAPLAVSLVRSVVVDPKEAGE